MAVNLVTVTGNLESISGGDLSLGRLWFRLNRPDWNLSGDIFAPEYVEAIASAGGAFSVALQSTDDLEAGASYSVILKYREPLDNKDREYTVGQFMLPTGGPYQLGDLLTVPFVEPVPADILALCQAYAVSAANDAVIAEAAADRAEAAAELVEGITAGQASSESTYVFVATAGQIVFSGVDAFGATLAFNNVPDVYHEGQWLSPNQFTANAALDTITLSYASNVGDVVSVKVRNWVVGNDSSMSNYRGETIQSALDRASFAEIAAPYTVKPLNWRWDLRGFLGGRAEIAKSETVQDWSEILEIALQSGEKVNIGAGVWPIRQALYADKGVSVVDVPVDVEAASDARLVFHGIDFEGGYFDLRSASEASLTNRWKPRWRGGVFDCTNLSTSLVYGISVFDVFHATDLDFSEMAFAGWNTALSAGTVDTAITLHKCPNFSVRKIAASGMTDSALYLSGDNTPGTFNLFADGGVVDGLTAYRCNNMVALKRWHRGANISNFLAVECTNGILSSPTDGSTTNHGHSALIHDGRIIRTPGRPIQITGGVDTKIERVVTEDYGCTLADTTIPTTVADDNNIAGIDLRATVDSEVNDCTIRQGAWAGTTQADPDKLITGIRLGRYSTSGSVYSTGCTLRGNLIDGAHRGILEDAGCSYNVVEDNEVRAPASGTYAVSAVLGTGSIHKPSEKLFSTTVDPASIAAGGVLIVDIPAVGVKKGDWVQHRFANRQASDTGIASVSVEAYAADDEVSLIIRNNHPSAAADIYNTEMEVLARATI